MARDIALVVDDSSCIRRSIYAAAISLVYMFVVATFHQTFLERNEIKNFGATFVLFFYFSH